MAIDNLNYYSAWLPAGQQTDRYSSQPWCLRSKNLDIFSSSKSVKATAFSTPTQADSDIIAEEWWLVLKTDWKVYERNNWVDTLVVDPSINYPVSQISYNWKNWTYEDSQRWTPQSMSVATAWNEWKSFVVFTDRSSFLYSKTVLTPKKTVTTNAWFTYEWVDSTYWYKYSRPWGNTWWPRTYKITIDSPKRAKMPLKIKWENGSGSRLKLYLQTISVTYIPKYYYDLAADDIAPESVTTHNLTWTWNLEDWLYFDIDLVPNSTFEINMTLGSMRQWDGSDLWWYFYADFNGWPEEWHYMKIDNVESDWDYNNYYSYLPIRDRNLDEIWVYWYSQSYWMKWDTYQYLYKWVSSFVEWKTWTEIIYDFVTDMGWANDPNMEVIWLTIWNEQVYMIWNLNGDWYVIPCDLTWWVWTPYIAYWCTFKWVTNIDYLMYLVWDDRGISQLWVFNQQELVSLVWGNQEKDSKNLIKNEEQYKFDWKIVEYRGNLILSTEDNRLFEYGQTYGGKWGTFIHEIDGEIKELKAKGNDLIVKYSNNNIDYTITYQDDTPIKNYNIEWMAEYPIVIWNHLLEKEESDLFVSYILPSADCSLEFWGMANHYHFRTFTSEDDYTFDSELSYKLKWATWDYELKYIETNGNQYTFRLVGDLPIQTTNDMKITDTEWVELINYSEYNHFRKIWTIETDKYCEWEFRFHNLNNKLELPKSHSLQIMVKGKGNQNYTPELFALDLVANQRERW